MGKKTRLLLAFGLSSLTGFSLILFYIFLMAYNNSNKMVLVTINTYGEAIPEIILFPVVLVCGLFSVGYVLWKKI